MSISSKNISVVLPAKNEAGPLADLLPELKKALPDAEITVVNDGSTDNTTEVCVNAGVNEVRHPTSRGNGAAVKSGLRAATRDIVVLMDADGQHSPSDIHKLLERLDQGYDMVVGARSRSGQASLARSGANAFYNRFASMISGTQIMDLTSGFRVARRDKMCEFLYLFPNGFSYPTTSTMAFLRAGYGVSYVPIDVEKRVGKSHISPISDGMRFLAIILKVGTLYAPLKLFLPISMVLFITGLSYFTYTITQLGRFTNMSVLLFTMSLIVFLVGLVSEQITVLLYKEQSQARQ